MSLIFDALFSSVALSHLVIDILNGQNPVLLTYLSNPLALTNATLALVSTLYTMMGALTQPIFGYLSDRVGARWVVSGGLLWMGGFLALGVTTPGMIALVFIVISGLGSGAFHPAGTSQATLRGRTHYAGRETTATSYFFLFGQIGLFLGPLLGGFLLQAYGPTGILFLAALTVPAAVNAAYRLRGTGPAVASLADEADASGKSGSSKLKIGFGLLIVFALMAALRAWAQQNMIVFLPKYLSDLGLSAGIYGGMAALFMGGSAVGNVGGGMLADRYGKQLVAGLTLVAASVPLFLIAPVGLSPILYLLIPLSGALTGASHSIVVVMAQRFIPGGMGLTSGLILGFMFTSGALGTLLTGALADQWGVLIVFPLSAAVSLAAGVLVIPLRRIEAPQGKISRVS